MTHADAAPRPPWRLKPLHVEGLPAVGHVPQQGTVLGRDPTCDLVLVGELFPTVSARHARVLPEGEGLVLEDLGSTNGTLVDGAPVTRRELAHGDVFQLGAGGPRFAVLSPRIGASVPGTGKGLARTAFAPRDEARVPAVAPADAPPEAHDAPHGVGAPPARSAPLGWAAVGLALVGALGAAWLLWRGAAGRERDRLAAQTFTRDVEARIVASQGQIEAQRAEWRRQREEFELAQVTWETARGELESERDALELRLASLEEEGATTSALAALERRLDDARRELARYDPALLERARIGEIERVERAVVLIETREVLVEPESGRVLHVVETAGGAADFNLDGRGAEFSRESTGSGLCVSADGHVLTNAHVVTGQRHAGTPVLTSHGWLEAQSRLEVVFSGTDRRHPAELVALRQTDREDLALLRLTPFEGMPHVDGLDVDLGIPPRGTEVYALGFPLGKRVLQAGDTVIASAFRGIVSRTVEPFVQVDAAIHPGASGGPVIDAQGRVIGIVTAMQSADPRASSSQIGYMLPIERVRAVWPPPTDR